MLLVLDLLLLRPQVYRHILFNRFPFRASGIEVLTPHLIFFVPFFRLLTFSLAHLNLHDPTNAQLTLLKFVPVYIVLDTYLTWLGMRTADAASSNPFTLVWTSAAAAPPLHPAPDSDIDLASNHSLLNVAAAAATAAASLAAPPVPLSMTAVAALALMNAVEWVVYVCAVLFALRALSRTQVLTLQPQRLQYVSLPLSPLFCHSWLIACGLCLCQKGNGTTL